jgi:hypothetical protein
MPQVQLVKKPIVEFWVFRVLLHRNRQLTLTEAMVAKVNAGEIILLDGGESIAEPVECFDEEMQAHERKRVLEAKYPGTDFRVVLNADVTV